MQMGGGGYLDCCDCIHVSPLQVSELGVCPSCRAVTAGVGALLCLLWLWLPACSPMLCMCFPRGHVNTSHQHTCVGTHITCISSRKILLTATLSILVYIVSIALLEYSKIHKKAYNFIVHEFGGF